MSKTESVTVTDADEVGPTLGYEVQVEFKANPRLYKNYTLLQINKTDGVITTFTAIMYRQAAKELAEALKVFLAE